jgi:hypothetical protein
MGTSAGGAVVGTSAGGAGVGAPAFASALTSAFASALTSGLASAFALGFASTFTGEMAPPWALTTALGGVRALRPLLPSCMQVLTAALGGERALRPLLAPSLAPPPLLPRSPPLLPLA